MMYKALEINDKNEGIKYPNVTNKAVIQNADNNLNNSINKNIDKSQMNEIDNLLAQLNN